MALIEAIGLIIFFFAGVALGLEIRHRHSPGVDELARRDRRRP